MSDQRGSRPWRGSLSRTHPPCVRGAHRLPLPHTHARSLGFASSHSTSSLCPHRYREARRGLLPAGRSSHRAVPRAPGPGRTSQLRPGVPTRGGPWDSATAHSRLRPGWWGCRTEDRRGEPAPAECPSVPARLLLTRNTRARCARCGGRPDRPLRLRSVPGTPLNAGLQGPRWPHVQTAVLGPSSDRHAPGGIRRSRAASPGAWLAPAGSTSTSHVCAARARGAALGEASSLHRFSSSAARRPPPRPPGTCPGVCARPACASETQGVTVPLNPGFPGHPCGLTTNVRSSLSKPHTSISCRGNTTEPPGNDAPGASPAQGHVTPSWSREERGRSRRQGGGQ